MNPISNKANTLAIVAMDINFAEWPELDFMGPSSLLGLLALRAGLEAEFRAKNIVISRLIMEGSIGDCFVFAMVNDRNGGLEVLRKFAHGLCAPKTDLGPIRVGWFDTDEEIWRCVWPHSGLAFNPEAGLARRVAISQRTLALGGLGTD